jgi:hypothetical protein
MIIIRSIMFLSIISKVAEAAQQFESGVCCSKINLISSIRNTGNSHDRRG